MGPNSRGRAWSNEKGMHEALQGVCSIIYKNYIAIEWHEPLLWGSLGEGGRERGRGDFERVGGVDTSEWGHLFLC